MLSLNRIAAGLVAACTIAFAAGCAIQPQMRQPVPGVPGVAYGHVQSVELIRAHSQTTGQGAILGGLIGAVVGRQIGSGEGRSAGTGVGAVAGAIIGNEIERQQRGAQDFERVEIVLDDGSVRRMDLPATGSLRAGDRVRIEGAQVLRL